MPRPETGAARRLTADRRADLRRIDAALAAAAAVLRRFTPGRVAAQLKEDGDPVTAADRAVNDVLAATLPAAGEGWLSEETADDAYRLDCRRVWVVDPLDGTREFIAGIPEWCVSIGLVEDGVAVAGGIANAATGDVIVGGLGCGVAHNGRAAPTLAGNGLAGATVLASRSEVRRGDWRRFEDAAFVVQPMGSVAYKLGRVAAGLEAATWTLTPKHEWDVAAGCALVAAAGGVAVGLDGEPLRFNRPDAKLAGMVACHPQALPAIRELLAI